MDSGTGRIGVIAGAALALLVAVVIWSQRPWAPDAAIRPDTGKAAARLDDAAMEGVLSELLRRIYSAFAAEEEGEIYDGLATAVASDLLTDLYLQRRAAQADEIREGGQNTVTDVSLTSWQRIETPGPQTSVAAEWVVTGIVGHEDHQHERMNAYAATLTLGPAEGEWRVTEFDLDQVRREEILMFFEGLE